MAKKKDFKASAQTVMDGYFSQKEEEPVKAEPKITGKKKDTHKPFSFWAIKKDADEWRLWAKAKGMKVDDLGNAAMKEYIENHPLSEDQNFVYEVLKKS